MSALGRTQRRCGDVRFRKAATLCGCNKPAEFDPLLPKCLEGKLLEWKLASFPLQNQ